MKTYSISIIIPCRNESVHIKECIASIIRQKNIDLNTIEIIAVDGISTDTTLSILTDLQKMQSNIQIIANPQRYVSSALNIGIRHSKGEFIARIDAHAVLDEYYLYNCLRMIQDHAADNVGGPALTHPRNYISRTISTAYHSFFAVGNAYFHQKNYEGYVDTVTFGFYRREVFDRIGLFDEDLIRNQDDELNLRLIKSGGTIYQTPSIKCYYTPRNNLMSLFKQYFQYGFWKVLVFKKHKMHASWRHYIPGIFVLFVLLGLPFCLIYNFFLPIYIGVLMVYLGFILTGSAISAYKDGWDLFPLLPIVFMIFHFSYGLGYLLGIWHFLVLNKDTLPEESIFTKLTR